MHSNELVGLWKSDFKNGKAIFLEDNFYFIYDKLKFWHTIMKTKLTDTLLLKIAFFIQKN